MTFQWIICHIVKCFGIKFKPLKTFHETDKSFQRCIDRGHNPKWLPIRLSYHGRAHYNSLSPFGDSTLFKGSLLRSPPGEYENIILEKLKIKNTQLKIERENAISNYSNDINKISLDDTLKLNENDKAILEYSRVNFAERIGKSDLDRFLEENLSNNKEGLIIDEALKSSEYFANEQDILNSVIEQSKRESADTDLTSHPSIRFIIEMGFTIEEAILAYSAVGEDPDHMLQYLYSMMT